MTMQVPTRHAFLETETVVQHHNPHTIWVLVTFFGNLTEKQYLQVSILAQGALGSAIVKRLQGVSKNVYLSKPGFLK